MKRTFAIVATCALILALAPSLDAQQTPLRTAIEAANRNFMTAFQKGDAAAVAALYTEDGEALPPNGEPVRGRPALEAMWRGVIDAGIASAKLTTREVEGVGPAVWESGTYELSGKDGALVDRGKYVVIWKRTNGQWQLHRDIWNSSQPAAR